MLKPLLEQELLLKYPHIVGVDEVGRGCLAGPVVGRGAGVDVGVGGLGLLVGVGPHKSGSEAQFMRLLT